jgi:hypothetical protein
MAYAPVGWQPKKLEMAVDSGPRWWGIMVWVVKDEQD